MDAAKIIRDARWRLEVGDITREQYEELIAPLRDVEVVRHGRWRPKFDGAFKGGAYWFECSGCNRTVPGGLQSGYYYCPNCGARMDGDGNE